MPRNPPPEPDHDSAAAAAQNGAAAKDAEPRMSLDARRDPEAAQPAELPQRGAVQAGHQRFVLTDSVAFR